MDFLNYMLFYTLAICVVMLSATVGLLVIDRVCSLRKCDYCYKKSVYFEEARKNR